MDRFEKSEAERTVDFERTTDNLTGEVVNVSFLPPGIEVSDRTYRTLQDLELKL